MLQPVLDVLKDALRPSSIFTCLLLVLLGVILLFSRSRATWGRRWLLAVVAGYWMISTPLGARMLIRGLSDGYGQIDKASDVPRGSVIVVLAGGSYTYRANGLSLDVPSNESAFRALEAARLYRLLGDPLIIASGGVVFPAGNPDPESEMLGKALMDLGIPRPRIVYESRSRNTLEQATEVKGILQTRHIDHFVLVTSPMHMKRSIGVFRATGLSPLPSVARFQSEGFPEGWLLLPRDNSLRLSDEAIYDYVALGYYWARGRLR